MNHSADDLKHLLNFFNIFSITYTDEQPEGYIKSTSLSTNEYIVFYNSDNHNEAKLYFYNLTKQESRELLLELVEISKTYDKQESFFKFLRKTYNSFIKYD